MVNVGFMDARVAYQQAIKNKEDRYKDIISKIRVQVMKAIDEGNTEFCYYSHIPQEVVEMLRDTNYEVDIRNCRNETTYTIKFKQF